MKLFIPKSLSPCYHSHLPLRFSCVLHPSPPTLLLVSSANARPLTPIVSKTLMSNILRMAQMAMNWLLIMVEGDVVEAMCGVWCCCLICRLRTERVLRMLAGDIVRECWSWSGDMEANKEMLMLCMCAGEEMISCACLLCVGSWVTK